MVDVDSGDSGGIRVRLSRVANDELMMGDQVIESTNVSEHTEVFD